MTPNNFIISLCFTALLSNAQLVQGADELLPTHLQQIESLQRRADKLAFGRIGSDNYHLAKARIWLDMALSEYHEKDSSGITAAAIAQAEILLDALDKKQTDIAMGTPMQIPGSETVRPDLWEKIATLKSRTKFSCGQRKIAEAEIHLVWTGHEKAESGWSHAQSYARDAEDLIYEAQVAIDNCDRQVVEAQTTAPAPQTASTAPSVTVIVEKHMLSTDALFAFGSSKLIGGATQRLDTLTETIKGWNFTEVITLVGHTDRFGSATHNQKLSEQRAERIRQYLITKGIAADKIHASGAGATQPLLACPAKLPRLEQISCLQPNRRVEIILRGVK